MKYNEYDFSWLFQFRGRDGEGYKKNTCYREASGEASQKGKFSTQRNMTTTWDALVARSIESYVATSLCSTADQQRSKKFG